MWFRFFFALFTNFNRFEHFSIRSMNILHQFLPFIILELRLSLFVLGPDYSSGMKIFDEKKIKKESKSSSSRRNMEEERKSESDSEIGERNFFVSLFCFFNLIFPSFFSFLHCHLYFFIYLIFLMFYIVLNLTFSESKVRSIYIPFVYGFFLQNSIFQCHPRYGSHRRQPRWEVQDSKRFNRGEESGWRQSRWLSFRCFLLLFLSLFFNFFFFLCIFLFLLFLFFSIYYRCILRILISLSSFSFCCTQYLSISTHLKSYIYYFISFNFILFYLI